MKNDAENTRFKIAQVARKLEISVDTIRMYEREGLLIPEKTASGQRFYNDRDVRWIEGIRRMIKEQGLNLQGIRRLLALMPCWKFRLCDDAEKKKCPAFIDGLMPCWTMKARLPEICREADCRLCSVYQNAVNLDHLKFLIYK